MVGSVALEYGVVDLHIGTGVSINSPPLEVACPPPGIGAIFSDSAFGRRCLDGTER
jgi:hypothetical protein